MSRVEKEYEYHTINELLLKTSFPSEYMKLFPLRSSTSTARLSRRNSLKDSNRL